MTKKSTTASKVVLCLMLFCSSAYSEELQVRRPSFEKGDVIIHGRITGIKPYNVDSEISLIGGRVQTSSMVAPDLDVNIFLDKNISMSVQTGISRSKIRLKDTAYGDIDVGSLKSASILVALQYYLNSAGKIQPYIGFGVLANRSFDEKPANAFIEKFEVSNQYAQVLKAGFEYHLGENWFLNAEAKQLIFSTQKFENQNVRAATKLNLATFGVGLGYRF